MKLRIIAICLLFATIAAAGQTAEVLYLKNGSVIRCNVVSQVFGESVTISTADGSVFVYKANEILKIERSATPNATQAETPGTVTDIDGNVYRTVKIGQQVWMAENLKTTRYADGVPIKDDKYEREAACTYHDKEYLDKYGMLYNWAAAVRVPDYKSVHNFHHRQGVCPQGWHLPSSDEVYDLIGKVKGKRQLYEVFLRLRSTSGWDDGENGNDEVGFSALAAGVPSHNLTGQMSTNVGKTTAFWTSSMNQNNNGFGGAMKSLAIIFRLGKIYNGAINGGKLLVDADKGLKASIRCIKD